MKIPEGKEMEKYLQEQSEMRRKLREFDAKLKEDKKKERAWEKAHGYKRGPFGHGLWKA